MLDEKLKNKVLRPDLMLRQVVEEVPRPYYVMCEDDEWPQSKSPV